MREYLFFAGRGGAVRCLALLLFVFGALPLAASASCTKEMAETLVQQNLDLRLQFIKSEKRLPVYEAAAAERSAKVRDLIGNKAWKGVCGEVFGLIAIADDVLAGGDGKGESLAKPWDRCTPEKVYALANEYDLICLPQRRIENCARRDLTPLRRELVNLKARVGRGDMKASFYVNETCRIYTEMLEIINK